MHIPIYLFHDLCPHLWEFMRFSSDSMKQSELRKLEIVFLGFIDDVLNTWEKTECRLMWIARRVVNLLPVIELIKRMAIGDTRVWTTPHTTRTFLLCVLSTRLTETEKSSSGRHQSIRIIAMID